MNRIWTVLVAVVVAFCPLESKADYLYDAFRDCGSVDRTLLYSAADPVIGSVPLQKSEISRVGSNFLVYTGFNYVSSTEYQGHLYGVRLYKEYTPYGNDWEFTNTNAANLFSTCGAANSACLFDAGKVLKDRTSARRIYTGNPGTPVTTSNGGYTLPIEGTRRLVGTTDGPTNLAAAWQAYAGLGPIANALPNYNATTKKWTCDRLPETVRTAAYCPTGTDSTGAASTLRNPSSTQFANLVAWLDGPGRRNWRLGDIYHSSAAIVEPPGLQYKDRFYPQFRQKLAKRPYMIYVGANDGMIHAFHASPDLEAIEKREPERWKAGEESWAYLPVNMLAKALIASDGNKQRFFSQDLSCRFTDVQVDRSYETSCNPDGGDDKYCGWRTVLLCGQGWGGSWYLALDVTDPLAPEPVKPLWEFTHFGSAGTAGIGRSWSLPSVSLVPLEEDNGSVQPRWIALFGSGYNSGLLDSADCGNANAGFKLAYRNLNLAFDGCFPRHGRGAVDDTSGTIFALDVANGQVLKSLPHTSSGAFVADGTVLDFDSDGLVDAGYMAAYGGQYRVRIASKAEDFSSCRMFSADRKKAPLTGHPTAFYYKSAPGSDTHDVVLVTGAGIDSGHDPDQQTNNGNDWSVTAQKFKEKKVAGCPGTAATCDLAAMFKNNFNDGDRKARLLGTPLFSRQANGDEWLLYTVWTAPHHNKICDDKEDKSTGIGYLMCMDLTLKDNGQPRCTACSGFGTNKKDPGIKLYENRIQPPSAPVSADGNVYVTNPVTGIQGTAVVDSQGHTPTPNSTPPKEGIPARLISWREAF
ncbi:PilC/PilY family type IV pilus protein [Vulgatibacter incomptus]|uniref:Type IV fimbrial biogenesis protein PilY1 n=1 Tax=Vulgatibacter incomptus TaxID=1391653 RepID=A0A0K1P9U6_9BACT|nr:PilC/PilY family type IV pilus protein [Vulgatibacter incomptus]AKU90303.1 Type IV fimbrial biogenesis protein PilY1 [Vulgatibacter incomptus]